MRGLIVPLVVPVCVASAADAAVKQWVGGAGTSFATPDNWVAPPDTEDPPPPPGPGDIADFTVFGGLVTFPAHVTNARTWVAKTVEFELLGNTYTTELDVTGAGDLTVRNGVINSNDLILGDGGELGIEADASLSVLNRIVVENGGRLDIIGGAVDTADATVGRATATTARVVVNGGTFSTTNTLILGDGGRGSFTLLNGGVLNAPAIVFGAAATGRGDFTVGPGSSLSLAGTTVIGEQGAGSIGVDGGSLTLQSVEIGQFGSGSLNIGDAGTVVVQSGDVALALNPGVFGSITIGSGTLTLPGSLLVGLNGNGRLRTDGGTLTVNGSLHLGSSPTSSGAWDLDTNESSRIVVEHSIIVGSRGVALAGAGGSGEIHGEIGAETMISANAFVVGDGGLGLVFFDEFEEGTLDFATSTIGRTHNGVMNVNGGFWNNTGSVTIGSGDLLGGPVEGAVSLYNTTVTSDSLVLGASIDSDGELEMSGGTWRISRGLTIGNNGAGSVRLNDGATMTTTSHVVIGQSVLGGSGSLSLGGAGTGLSVTTAGQGVKVGPGRSGILSLSEGATLKASFLFIAEGLGSRSSVFVSGPDTRVEINGGVRLDESGNGSLSIVGGATVDSAIATVDNNGLAFGHNAVVSGVGSMWRTIDLSVGHQTTAGGLLVDRGARVECHDCAIGENAGAKGSVLLRDADTRLDVIDDLFVGGNHAGVGGEAIVAIESGAGAVVGDDTTV